MKSSIQAARSQQANLDIKLHKSFDIPLVTSAMLLLGIGLVMVASSSIEIADRATGDPLYYFKRQVIFAVIGVLAAIVVTRIRLMYWENSGIALLFLMVALLVLVLVPGLGRTVHGSTRWLNLGPFGLQVSEVVKLLLIVYLAGYLVKHGKQVIESFSGFTRPMLVLIVLFTLLLLEPDFGAAIVLLVTALGMFCLAGAKIWNFLILFVASALSMSVVAVSSPYSYGTPYCISQSLV